MTLKSQNFELPEFQLPRYSLICISNAYFESSTSAFAVCEDEFFLAIWKYDIVEMSMWPLTKKLPIDKSISQFCPPIDFEFDENEISNLLVLMSCPCCASMVDFITNEMNRPWKIKVQPLIEIFDIK